MLAEAILVKSGYQVDIAKNGRVALEMLDRNTHDLVLMDCQMPEIDGFEATTAIRSQEQLQQDLKRIPNIALTANAIDGDRKKCLAAGMDDYLSKPFCQERFIETVNHWLFDEQ